jgi:hypothetical protein
VADLLQVDRLVVSLRIELRAPHLVRALMVRRPEADERSEPHVEVADAFQAIDQLLSVGPGTGAPQPFQQQAAIDVAFERTRVASMGARANAVSMPSFI